MTKTNLVNGAILPGIHECAMDGRVCAGAPGVTYRVTADASGLTVDVNQNGRGGAVESIERYSLAEAGKRLTLERRNPDPRWQAVPPMVYVYTRQP